MSVVVRELIGKRFGIIQKVILALAVFAMSVVWPLGAFSVAHVSEGTWDGVRMSGASNETDFVKQDFVPVCEDLDAVSVYICNDADSFDTMQVAFRIFDHAGQRVSEHFLQLEEYKTPSYVRIPVELKVTPGEVYFYTIVGVDNDLVVAYSSDDTRTLENGALSYKGIVAGGTSIVTKYEYTRPMGLKRILFCDGLIAGVAAALILCVGLLRKKVLGRGQNVEKAAIWRKLESIVKYVITGLTSCAVILAFYGIVIKRLFTDDVLNIVVLFAGVLIAAVWLLFEVFHCKSELEPLLPDEQDVVEKGIRLIRSLLLAVTIIMCCMYQNGGSNYEKGLYIRRILTFFALFMVSTGKKKQILNLFTILWTPAAWLFGRYYISLHSEHMEHIQTATQDAWVIWVIGLLVIHLIYRIKDGDFKKLKEISVPYAVVVEAFWILCIVFANGRTWPAVLCVAFTLWGLFYITSTHRKELLEDICNGILWAFAGSVIFCLYRRPYQYYMLTRYAGIFFTVTVTATYYLIPMAAALVKVLLAGKEGNRKKVISAWMIYGVIAAYMAFTASRTGIIAMAVMTLFAFVLPWKEEKKVLCKKLKGVVVMIASMLMAFMMTFSATRMVPAMAGNPFYFDWEKPNAYINAKTPWEGGESLSETYIDIQKSLQMLFGRLLTNEAEGARESSRAKEVLPGTLLVAKEVTGAMITNETVQKYSNGRLDIFKAYAMQLTMTGHDTMSATAENGEAIIHAHNSFLQVAFDFGIPVGILFLLLVAWAFIKALWRAWHVKDKNVYEILPVLVIVGFEAASLFEWIYHLGNPLGFNFMLLLIPLMVKRNKRCEQQE